ncbi:MAG: methionyl-tRNA formyltransferase [Deltaproteobacteria bacterium]|nr:methionyl-tRNA formyltransferase [Deltaproteobacteria bacterium]
MKILFAGSPEIALPSLEALLASGEEIIGVISQPDRPVGRGRKLSSPPVATLAKKSQRLLFQPEKLDDSFLRTLTELSPDLIVVVAYGKILPKKMLMIPPQGCLNLHFSLLPKYRGAAPVQWALINGEAETGVTTLKMVERLDAGPIYLQRKVPIQEEDNSLLLGKRLANIGAELLVETIQRLKEGKLQASPQVEEMVTWAPSLEKEDGLIDWNCSAKAIFCKIRGTNPWPGAYTFLDTQRLKIYTASVIPEKNKKQRPGEILATHPSGIDVACGHGILRLEELQLEGGKRLSAAEFLRGHPLEVGTKLGS